MTIDQAIVELEKLKLLYGGQTVVVVPVPRQESSAYMDCTLTMQFVCPRSGAGFYSAYDDQQNVKPINVVKAF